VQELWVGVVGWSLLSPIWAYLWAPYVILGIFLYYGDLGRNSSNCVREWAFGVWVVKFRYLYLQFEVICELHIWFLWFFYTLLSPGRKDSKFCIKMSIMEVRSPLNILFVRVLSISNLFVVAICLLQGYGWAIHSIVIGSENWGFGLWNFGIFLSNLNLLWAP